MKKTDPSALSVSALRADIYKIVDQVLQTGVPVEIERNGKKLRIVPEERAGKLARLKPRKGLRCAAGELVNITWESAWTGHDLP